MPTTRKTSHFLNGIMIGAMSTMGLALLVILGFLWVCLLSRKGKMGEKYVKVDKQHLQDVGKFDVFTSLLSPSLFW